MLILTGSAGFIGSHLTRSFQDRTRLLLIDTPSLFRDRGYLKLDEINLFDWAHGQENRELRHRTLDYQYFPKVLEAITPEYAGPKSKEAVLIPAGEKIEGIIHMGACVDTGEKRKDFFDTWNVEYTKSLWNWCAKFKIPFIYASSAATYGNGDQGFSDSWETALKLKPLNPYGQSKQDFDLWAYEQIQKGNTPPHYYGLKFFNVFGDCEAHKGSMISPVLRSYRHLQRTGRCQLFRSHNPKCKDGEQTRDFVHVSDIVSLVNFFWERKPKSALYNCGTGKSRTFLDMMKALCKSTDNDLDIDWIDTPEQYRAAYQYFTEADMSSVKSQGYETEPHSLEEGVARYVKILQETEPQATFH